MSDLIAPLAKTPLAPELEPWRPWLGLFQPDLLPFVADMLLCLTPLVGRLHQVRMKQEMQPQGVGDIVRRGPVDRILLSEFAWLELAPDEFLRRYANHETLYTGPQPEASHATRYCIALFDNGPIQIGEPRLLHMVLLILLARRAEEAGAVLRWGILQLPGQLHDVGRAEAARHALQELIKARSSELVSAQHLDQWQQALAALDGEVADCWKIGGDSGAAVGANLCGVTAQVAIRRDWLLPNLNVVLTQRHQTRRVALPVPPGSVGLRLLLEPFEATRKPVHRNQIDKRLDLNRAPFFSHGGDRIVVWHEDASASLLSLLINPAMPMSKPVLISRRRKGRVLAQMSNKKALAAIVLQQERLRLFDYPGTLYHKHRDLPWPAQMLRPPGDAESNPAPVYGKTFYLQFQKDKQYEERILFLNHEQQLGVWCFTRPDNPKSNVQPRFRLIANQVLEAVQYGELVDYAVQKEDRVECYRWYGQEVSGVIKVKSPGTALRVLFGCPFECRPDQIQNFTNGPRLVAFQRKELEWDAGYGNERHTIHVAGGTEVFGLGWHGPSSQVGLLLVHPDRMSIQFYGTQSIVNLYLSSAPVRQVAFDALKQSFICVNADHTVMVQRLDMQEPLLIAQFDGGGRHGEPN